MNLLLYAPGLDWPTLALRSIVNPFWACFGYYALHFARCYVWWAAARRLLPRQTWVPLLGFAIVVDFFALPNCLGAFRGCALWAHCGNAYYGWLSDSSILPCLMAKLLVLSRFLRHTRLSARTLARRGCER